VALFEAIEAQGAHQAQNRQGAQAKGGDIRQTGRQQRAGDQACNGDSRNSADADDVETAKIEDPQPGGVSLAGVQPDIGTKGTTTRMRRG